MTPLVGTRILVLTHDGFKGLDEPVKALAAICEERGLQLCAERSEPAAESLARLDVELVDDALATGELALAITLGGDGTILRALRRLMGTDVPVFAVNFGQVGFLATVEPGELSETFTAAIDGAFERLDLPAVSVTIDGNESWAGINDVSIHRRLGTRVAELGYGVGKDVLGAVRCDGLVACTPAGSTGYNLANGGPILAWGVEGYGVSFISPHSLTARSIVVSPVDHLVVENRGQDALELAVDGRVVSGLVTPGSQAVLAYRPKAAVLAQAPGVTFYARMREKFGHLRG